MALEIGSGIHIGGGITVTIESGGGGGSTTYTQFGNWMGAGFIDMGGGNWFINFGLAGSVDSGLLTALNALTAGSTLSVTKDAETVLVTVQTVNGQPYNSSTATLVEIFTTDHPASQWFGIDSITI